MRDLGEAGGWRGADPARRAVDADQLREAHLDRRVAPAQRVVFGVADLRRVFGIIAPVVMSNFGGESGQLAFRLRPG